MTNSEVTAEDRCNRHQYQRQEHQRHVHHRRQQRQRQPMLRLRPDSDPSSTELYLETMAKWAGLLPR